MDIPIVSSTFLSGKIDNNLPPAVFANHNISDVPIGTYFCLALNCTFAIHSHNACHYYTHLNDIKNIFAESFDEATDEVKTNDTHIELEQLKQKVIDKFITKLKEMDLIQKESSDLFKTFLHENIFTDRKYTISISNKNVKAIKKCINELNQRCPVTEQKVMEKYVDITKPICSYSAIDYKDKPVENFLSDNISSLRSFLSNIFFNQFENLKELTIVLTEDGDIEASLKILAPNCSLRDTKHKSFSYSKITTEQGKNGYEVFKNLEVSVITDIAMEKLKESNITAFIDMTDVFIRE